MLKPIILSVAGSDSSAGAGIQADIKTAQALGVYVGTAITAVTAQNGLRVLQVDPVRVEMVVAQMRAVLEGAKVGAIKIGMLATEELVEAVAQMLEQFDDIPVVLDPVLMSSSGAMLLEPGGVRLLRERLIPRVNLVTPNIPEVEVLTGLSLAQSQGGVQPLAAAMHAFGCDSVLIKGGHAEGEIATDWLFERGARPVVYSAEKVVSVNTRGTGCALSTAIAVGWVRGMATSVAVEFAKKYLTETLRSSVGIRMFKGAGPLSHGAAIIS